MLDQILARSLDPTLLAKACGINPDPWQETLLRSSSKQILLLCSRQSGKSTMSALFALHQAIYRQKTLTLLLSPSLRQSQELFLKVQGFYKFLPQNQKPPVKNESAQRLELKNGSRIVSLPENQDTIRGFSGVNLLIIDEAAFVDDALYHAVRPMLAVSGGKIIALSTPHGKRGWFFEAWQQSQSWEQYKVTADQCPRISKEFLQSERTQMPAFVFDQEYFCEFKENQNSVFSYDLIQKAVSSDVKPLNLFKSTKIKEE